MSNRAKNTELFWNQLQSHWYLYLALTAAVMVAFYLCYRRETRWSGLSLSGAILVIGGIIYADFSTQPGFTNVVAQALSATLMLTVFALLLMSIAVILWSRTKQGQTANASQ